MSIAVVAVTMLLSTSVVDIALDCVLIGLKQISK